MTQLLQTFRHDPTLHTFRDDSILRTLPLLAVMKHRYGQPSWLYLLCENLAVFNTHYTLIRQHQFSKFVNGSKSLKIS